ncbi:MAG: gamma-glutamyl-gamma-aminobutyrate hydrolase family protein [Candidatus Limnocylindrales bacterium]
MSSNRFPGPPPTIVVTVQAPGMSNDPAVAKRKNGRYAEQVEAAGGRPVVLDETAGPEQRADAFAAMDGLLLSGGADLDPALYGQAPAGSVDIEPGRDALELAAWLAARERSLPVLGVCRGVQAINVFAGGSLIQHLDGHTSAAWPSRDVKLHPLRISPASRMARILRPNDPGGVVLSVNSYHHQGFRADQLAPGLVASGSAPHPEGELVEAIESSGSGQLLLGVQCHPERTESTPPEFARLWAFFVDACRRRSG